jgi:hypothetical protein
MRVALRRRMRATHPGAKAFIVSSEGVSHAHVASAMAK